MEIKMRNTTEYTSGVVFEGSRMVRPLPFQPTQKNFLAIKKKYYIDKLADITGLARIKFGRPESLLKMVKTFVFYFFFQI